jgi:uncharacterized UBP type Zn finger protein
MFSQKLCEHLKDLQPKAAKEAVCEECVKTGSHWVHLRVCQQCGGVHCCDSSPNKHATKHFHATGHPVITSAEPGEHWAWCYKDALFMEY